MQFNILTTAVAVNADDAAVVLVLLLLLLLQKKKKIYFKLKRLKMKMLMVMLMLKVKFSWMSCNQIKVNGKTLNEIFPMVSLFFFLLYFTTIAITTIAKNAQFSLKKFFYSTQIFIRAYKTCWLVLLLCFSSNLFVFCFFFVCFAFILLCYKTFVAVFWIKSMKLISEKRRKTLHSTFYNC